MPPGRDETTARSTRPILSVAMKVRSSSPSSSTKSAGPKVIRVVSAGPNGSASSQGAAAETVGGDEGPEFVAQLVDEIGRPQGDPRRLRRAERVGLIARRGGRGGDRPAEQDRGKRRRRRRVPPTLHSRPFPRTVGALKRALYEIQAREVPPIARPIGRRSRKPRHRCRSGPVAAHARTGRNA